MPANTRLVVRDEDHEIIGYITNYGCENPHCITAIVNGKRWHARPARSGVTLPEYHFGDLDRALDALHGAKNLKG